MNRNTVFFPRHALAVAIALASAGTAHAQDAQTLDSVVVTGTRTQEGPGTLAASTVITREDIDRLQPSSLPELLPSGLCCAKAGGCAAGFAGLRALPAAPFAPGREGPGAPGGVLCA